MTVYVVHKFPKWFLHRSNEERISIEAISEYGENGVYFDEYLIFLKF